MPFKSGFVAIIGKPNVGKSTLLNAILKKKVAIATPKPQTTRDNIRGILTMEDCQIVFIDTPGIHKPRAKLNEMMVKHAYDAIRDVDMLMLLIDATKPLDAADRLIIDSIRDMEIPKFLVVNKIDKLNKSELLDLLAGVDTALFDEIIPVSALRSRNIEELINTVKNYLKEDVQYYPSDMISDYPEEFMISEIIREKIMLNTEQEIPHAIAVTIENIEHKKEVDVINALIVCEKPSQKSIIIGKRGEKLKEIASFARSELEERLQKKVFLEVFVSVEENWRNKKYQLSQFGYYDRHTDE
ncbi:MAG: GTPase Era [Erysipelotrichaceae bacterium]|nr:GTPase Era [Erysipelotrichaceae bacterium]